jgi:hypothetical protein
MNESNCYATGCTLRFPRIVRVREVADKGWDGVNSIADLQSKEKQSNADGANIVRRQALRSAQV